jgi:hypothetical protein
MQTIYIEHEGDGKTRAFRALLLAYVCAAKLWDGGDVSEQGKTKHGSKDKLVRPVYMMIGGSKSECATVIANLRSGEKGAILGLDDSTETWVTRKAQKIELRRSAKYAIDPQLLEVDVATEKRPECHEAKLYDLCREDPGMVDPTEVKFLSLPKASWIDPSTVDVDGVVSHMQSIGYKDNIEFLRLLALLAPFFATRLAARSLAPLVADLRFFVQVLVASLKCKLATMGAEAVGGSAWAYDKDAGYVEYGLSAIGLLPGIAFRATHEDVKALLIEQVKLSPLWRS